MAEGTPQAASEAAQTLPGVLGEVGKTRLVK